MGDTFENWKAGFAMSNVTMSNVNKSDASMSDASVTDALVSDAPMSSAASPNARLGDASRQPVGGSLAAMPTPDNERNEIFSSLVGGDTDIVGLVAYSIYKQNKQDWLVAFGKARGREPGEAEITSYIVGESTARRLSTYRHLAEATLEGRGPTMTSGPASSEDERQRNYAIAARAKPAAPAGPVANLGIIGIIGLAVVAIVALILVTRYGFPAGK